MRCATPSACAFRRVARATGSWSSRPSSRGTRRWSSRTDNAASSSSRRARTASIARRVDPPEPGRRDPPRPRRRRGVARILRRLVSQECGPAFVRRSLARCWSIWRRVSARAARPSSRRWGRRHVRRRARRHGGLQVRAPLHHTEAQSPASATGRVARVPISGEPSRLRPPARPRRGRRGMFLLLFAAATSVDCNVPRPPPAPARDGCPPQRGRASNLRAIIRAAERTICVSTPSATSSSASSATARWRAVVVHNGALSSAGRRSRASAVRRELGLRRLDSSASGSARSTSAETPSRVVRGRGADLDPGRVRGRRALRAEVERAAGGWRSRGSASGTTYRGSRRC